MKKQILKKLKSQAGETLVETLFAILIATFASILLASSTTTAMELNRQARERDARDQLCLEKLANDTDTNDTGKEPGQNIIIKPMTRDASGKWISLTDAEGNDVDSIVVNGVITYVGCVVDDDTGELGDYSTYRLEISKTDGT